MLYLKKNILKGR